MKTTRSARAADISEHSLFGPSVSNNNDDESWHSNCARFRIEAKRELATALVDDLLAQAQVGQLGDADEQRNLALLE